MKRSEKLLAWAVLWLLLAGLVIGSPTWNDLTLPLTGAFSIIAVLFYMWSVRVQGRGK